MNMNINQNELQAVVELKPWVQPKLTTMEAGSAELQVNGANDGPNQVS